MKSYIYGLFYNGKQIDQTSIDELNSILAYSIMQPDHKEKDENLLSVSFINEVYEELPKTLDSFTRQEEKENGYFYFAEYDGLHFQGRTIKSTINKILKYIFNDGSMKK